jgi:hypothetical protein
MKIFVFPAAEAHRISRHPQMTERVSVIHHQLAII